jgi:hypothetical protein
MNTLKHAMLFAAAAGTFGCGRVPFCEAFAGADQCVAGISSTDSTGEDSGTSEYSGTSEDGGTSEDSGTSEDGDVDTDEPDMDMDGVADDSDNCPEVSNSNQLDYDANGLGNVCDTQVFASVTGNLNTLISMDAGIGGMCEISLVLEVTNGYITVQLDDDAAVAAFEIDNLQIADILDMECMLLVTAYASLTSIMIENGGGPFPVSMPHSLAMHDAGQIAGVPNPSHPVLSFATISASVDLNPPMESQLALDGALPIFTADIVLGGASGTLSFTDTEFVLGMGEIMIQEPLPLPLEFALIGLVGSLTLAP